MHFINRIRTGCPCVSFNRQFFLAADDFLIEHENRTEKKGNIRYEQNMRKYMKNSLVAFYSLRLHLEYRHYRQ